MTVIVGFGSRPVFLRTVRYHAYFCSGLFDVRRTLFSSSNGSAWLYSGLAKCDIASDVYV